VVPFFPENPMNTKHRSLILAFILSIPCWASAQTQQAPPPPSLIENLFFTLLPILLIGAFIWFFFIRQMRKMPYRFEEAQRHNLAVEKLLERIAIALEKNKDGR
jgi:prolipoprotein diacylglyceryltransferase